jgi:vacuolar protein sorting-associated protein 26
MDLIAGLLTKPPTVQIIFENNRNKQTVKNSAGNNIDIPVYHDTDNIQGHIVIFLNKNKNYEHNGIKVELIGVIENHRDKKQTSKFITITKDLIPPGTIDNEKTTADFEFSKFEKLYESYKGTNAGVRYYISAIISTKYKNIVEDKEFLIYKPIEVKDLNNEEVNLPIQMEIGIEEWLHISFDVHRSKFHLRDIIEGEVTFKKVSLRLESMEIQIIKRETLGVGKISFKVR